MDFVERMFAQLKFHQLLADMPGEQFESFFHKLMNSRYPDFVSVRTHGSLGDMGADGLLLNGRTLYACYSPQTHSFSAVKSKFLSDLAKARTKRSGDFDVFAFVHNDIRGVHPELSKLLSMTQEDLRPVKVHLIGKDRLWHEIMQLDRTAVEDLLACPILVRDKTFGVGLADLEPLLVQLSRSKATAAPAPALTEVSQYKIEYNRLDPEVREVLIKGLRHSYLVDDYYAQILDVEEHDRVAQGFRIYYDQLRDRTADHEVLWLELEKYVVGNERVTLRTTWAATVVIAHFFERCDVFDVPPPDWSPVPAPRESV